MPVAPPAPRRAALRFIFITVLLDMLAFGMIIPVLPKLIESFMDGDTARAAEVYGLFGTIWALMQLVCMPIIGGLSDRFGRRPVILLSVLGLGLDFVLMALAPNIAWLLVGRILSGMTSANISTSSAYIADVTPPEERSAAFGLMGAAFGIGFILGPAVGGLLGAIGPRMPFWVAAVCALANAAYGLFVLPESLPHERRSPFRWRRANPVGALAMIRARPELSGLAVLKFVMDLAHTVLPSSFVLYASYRYGWTSNEVGIALGAVGLGSMVVQAGLVGPVVKRLGERVTLPLGLLFGTAGFVLYGIAETPAVFLLGVPCGALMGLAGPSLQSLLTRRVGPGEQGQLQGALASIQGFAGILGPGLFTQTFAWFIRPGAPVLHPGAAFLLAAGMMVVALGLALREGRTPALV